MDIETRLNRLRAKMKDLAIDACYIGTGDPHNSEYVAEHFQARAWLTGFKGSAGTAVVTADRALLWTDGRYHIQAARDLDGTPFDLMKQGLPGVPRPDEWMKQMLPEGARIAVDGTVLPDATVESMEKLFAARGFELVTDLDLIGAIWIDRPPLPSGNVFEHKIEFTGRDASDKISEVREKMKLDGADYALYVGLDDIAWLMNFRGSDVPNNCVALAFALVLPDTALLFIDESNVNDDLRAVFHEQGIELRDYHAVFSAVRELPEGVLVVDTTRVSRALIEAVPPKVKIIKKQDYPYLMKAVLNDTELFGQFRAGVRDSVAVTKYLYYIKHEAAVQGLNEMEGTEKLHELRALSDAFIIESFPTISAYGANAAMMHYQATPERHDKLQPRGFYLVDCGSQAYDGTTDITRTCSLGSLTEEEKVDYTLTLKSHIALASLPFLDGTCGTALDAVARSVMWRYGLDYKCGTGHGFGYVSGVHEGPQRLTNNPLYGDYKFRENIVITIEPGVYRQDKHGIRLENDYVVLRKNKMLATYDGAVGIVETPEELNEAGDIFLIFQTLTFVPFDRDAILLELLSDEELDWLNTYHDSVRHELLPYFEGDERAFLMRETEPFTVGDNR